MVVHARDPSDLGVEFCVRVCLFRAEVEDAIVCAVSLIQKLLCTVASLMRNHLMFFYHGPGLFDRIYGKFERDTYWGPLSRVFFKSEPRAAFWRPVVPVVSPGPLSGQHSPVNKGGDRQCRPSNGENPRVVRAGRLGGGAMGLPDAESV